ncbi:MAG: type II secretion system F family protein, partial [Gammaproteobacteria bacterium]|nr:type II secretion system F family protein [Gammaproteobacteria bacterium]
MPAFDYKALDKNGKETSGVLEGESEKQIRQQLRSQGLLPMSIEAVVNRSSNKSKFSFKALMQPISVGDISLLTRQLATMLSAGIPLEETLQSVAEQSEKAHIRSMMTSIRNRVLEGFSLAQ